MAMEAEGLAGFAQRETYGDEIRETFLNRSDQLNLRIRSTKKRDVYDQYSKGRPDFLKSYCFTELGGEEGEKCKGQRHELEFFPREGGEMIKYTHECSKAEEPSKGAWSFTCHYDQDTNPHGRTSQFISLRPGEMFRPDLDPPSTVRGKIASLGEDFEPSFEQPYLSWRHDFETGEVVVKLAPTVSSDPNDPDGDDSGALVYPIHRFKPDCDPVVEADVSDPSREELSGEYEWALQRQEGVIREVMAMERWLYIFNHSFTTDPTNGTQAAVHQWRNVETFVSHLFDLIDRCDVKAQSDDRKGKTYDSMDNLYQHKIASLEQQLRQRDSLISALTYERDEAKAQTSPAQPVICD